MISQLRSRQFGALSALVVIVLLTVFGLRNCTKSSGSERGYAEASMRILLRSYMIALNECDYDKIVGHYNSTFTLFQDGKTYNHDDALKLVLAQNSYYQHIESSLDDIQVRVITADVAAAYLSFHQAAADKKGTITHRKGEATWVAVRASGEWKFAYAHAWSIPDTVSQ